MQVEAVQSMPEWSVRWWASLDSRPRTLALRRVLVPWAEPAGAKATEPKREIPEIAGGNWLAGRRIFFDEQAACYRCHVIRGQGRPVGPDLSNLVHRDYASVFRDITQPNAAINPDHVAYELETKDGYVYSGVLRKDGEDEVVLADALGREVTVPRADIEVLKPLRLSLMPEGIGEVLDAQSLKDLMTFLLTTPLEPAPREIDGAPPARTMAEFHEFAPDLPEAGRTN